MDEDKIALLVNLSVQYFTFKFWDFYIVLYLIIYIFLLGFPGGSEGKASACDAEDSGLIPGSGRSPGEGNGNPFQYSCLENPMDRETWWPTVHGVAKSLQYLVRYCCHTLT